MSEEFTGLGEFVVQKTGNRQRKTDIHWQDMPEFVQEKEEPYAKIIVRFETKEDLDDFSSKIGQDVPKGNPSIWHPKLQRGKNSNKRYVDDTPFIGETLTEDD